MYPLLRAARVLAAAWRAPRMKPLAESVLTLRVWPGDLDYNLHLNNGRYLTLMDLGRLDLMIRAGAMAVMRRERWGGVVASLAVRYRRPLGPFRRFTLRTRVVGWDEQWIFMEQRFERDGEPVAYAMVKTTLVSGAGRVPPAALLAAAGSPERSPPIPDAVRCWEQAEQAMQRAAEA